MNTTELMTESNGLAPEENATLPAVSDSNGGVLPPEKLKERGSKYVGLALEFVALFPVGATISAKELDDFLISRGLISNPGVRGPGNPLWDTHVKERNTWLGRLNGGGTSPALSCNFHFSVDVLTAGERYAVRTLYDSAKSRALDGPQTFRKYIGTYVKHIQQRVDVMDMSHLTEFQKADIRMQLNSFEELVEDVDHATAKVSRRAEYIETLLTPLVSNEADTPENQE